MASARRKKEGKGSAGLVPDRKRRGRKENSAPSGWKKKKRENMGILTFFHQEERATSHQKKRVLERKEGDGTIASFGERNRLWWSPTIRRKGGIGYPRKRPLSQTRGGKGEEKEGVYFFHPNEAGRKTPYRGRRREPVLAHQRKRFPSLSSPKREPGRGDHDGENPLRPGGDFLRPKGKKFEPASPLGGGSFLSS